MPLLKLCNVTKEYFIRSEKLSWFDKKRKLTAVKQVNVNLAKGEILGLVGESGSGKSTLAKLIMNLEPVTSGTIQLDGQMISDSSIKDIKLYKRIQMVLQDSSSSLYPNMKIEDIIAEPIRNYFPLVNNVKNECINLLELVGLDASYLTRLSKQLSGGQKQRVCIAKALAVKPDIIIFDESIASLDLASQVSILKMLKSIQEREQLSYVFITHDLQSTLHFCDRVAIMYQGELVEVVDCWDIKPPEHPYSRLLFESFGE